MEIFHLLFLKSDKVGRVGSLSFFLVHCGTVEPEGGFSGAGGCGAGVGEKSDRLPTCNTN